MTRKTTLTAALAALALVLTTSTALAATAVARQGVNIRAGASTDSRIIGQLAAGEEVEVVGCGGGWCELEDGGYVAQSYLAIGGYADDDDDDEDELDDEDDDTPVAFDRDEGEFDEDPLGFEEITPQSLQDAPEDDDDDEDEDDGDDD